MRTNTLFVVTTFLLVVAVGSVGATGITLKLSGPGAAGEATIKAGQRVSIDIVI